MLFGRIWFIICLKRSQYDCIEDIAFEGVKMKNKKIAIYSRKSKYTGKGESIENQIEQCREYIKINYSDLADNEIMVFEDEGYSGKNLVRPKFQEMMKEIQRGNIRMLVCYRIDRISRNVSDFSGIIEELNRRNTTFVSIREKFDTDTPMGKAMMYICSVFAELERDTIAERIRDNMYELAKTGRWLGGNTPTGYESVPVQKLAIDGKIRTAYKLSIVDKEADIVKLIFKKFIEFNSQSKLETYLLQNRIFSRNNKRFTRCTIKAILENPEYARADKDTLEYFKEIGANIYADESEFDGRHGIMTYNKTQQNKRTKKAKPINEWIVTVGKHEAIIDSSDWIKAQKMLAANKSKSYRKPRSQTALLSGLLICGHCGDYMRPKMYRGLDEDGNQKFGYLCYTKEASRQMDCKMKNAPGNLIDKAVCDEIKKLSEDSLEFVKQLEKAKSAMKSNTSEYIQQIEKLSEDLINTERKIKNLISALSNASERKASDYILNEIESLDIEKQQIEKQITDLKALSKRDELSEIEFDLIKEAMIDFGKAFDTMTIDEKRSALRLFVNKVVWDGENVDIYLFGADNEEPLGRGCK